MQYGDLITVIIPVHNRARSIERAAYSVLNQSYRNIELIIVDDCSTDNTVALIEAIDDPRLRLIRHDTNKGAAGARNTGIDAAKSALIAFQDSDDFWLPEKLEMQMQYFCQLSDDYIATFHVMVIYGRNYEGKNKKYGPRRASCEPDPRLKIESGDLSRAFLKGNFMGPPTVLLKRQAFYDAGGFDFKLKNNDDWDLHLRLSQMGKIGFLEKPLMIVYDSPDGISKRREASASSMVRILGKIRKLHPENQALAPHTLTVSRIFMLKGKPKSSLKYLKKTIALEPRRPAHYMRYGLSLIPKLYCHLLEGRRKSRVVK